MHPFDIVCYARRALSRRGRWASPLALLLPLLLGLPVLAAPSRAEQPHQVYLPLTAAGGPSSAELIDAALARGEIDAETALIYQAFAIFEDPRLPAAYRGDDSRPSDREIAGQLAARFDQLSPQAKAILEPFSMPPYHTGSWWDLRQRGALGATAAPSFSPTALRCGQTGNVKDPLFNQWHYIDSPGGAVRVWWQARYPQDEAKANNYARVIDDIWLKLATLMRRQPPSDEGETKICRGGDNRLDISLVDLGNNGEAWPYTFEPVATPSYLLLNRDAKLKTLIHELMHAFQFAYDVAGSFSEYSWWREATASWAIHYIDSKLNDEHSYAPQFLEAPELPLEHYSLEVNKHGHAHQYGAYLFPLFRQLKTGQPDLARTSWEQFELFTDSLAAINGLLDGGFSKQWPEFTLRNVNQPPVDEYWKADKLPNQAKLKLNQKVELQGSPSVTYPLDDSVQHLAAHHFHFGFADASVRSVAFENPFSGGTFPTAHVRAVYRVDGGQWTSEDWTDKQYVTFCRDMKAERVSELYIVISNSEWKDRSHVLKPASAPRLLATNLGCRGWEAEVTETATLVGHMTNITETVTTQATFERHRPGGVTSAREEYRTTKGTANWDHNGVAHRCTGGQRGTYPVADTGDTGAARARLLLDQYGVSYLNGAYVHDGSRRYYAVGNNQASVTTSVTYTCPGTSYEHELIHFNWLNSGPASRGLLASNDGRTIVGTYTETSTRSNGYVLTRIYSWKMTALPPE